ncbi:MAG: WXG100 family type VII secretion target [Clostridia bacterium]|nr:WXG100 family type VII secretion target [Clostridia bacterium]
MSNISIDFERTMRQANKLDEYADTLRNMSRREYAEAMRNLSGDWVSDSASAFLGKGEHLRSDIERTARDIETIANNIRRAARRIYEAEKKAEELAKQRMSLK